MLNQRSQNLVKCAVSILVRATVKTNTQDVADAICVRYSMHSLSLRIQRKASGCCLLVEQACQSWKPAKFC